MGLLFEKNYWANVTNDMWKLRPAPGEILKHRDASTFFSIACKSLSDLIHDDSFGDDLEEALIMSSRHSLPIRSALDEFIRFEKKLAMDSGVDVNAATALGRAVRSTQSSLYSPSTKPITAAELSKSISGMRDIACKARSDLNRSITDSAERGPYQRTIRATRGVAVLAFNAGTPVAAASYSVPAGVAVNILLSHSITSGAQLVKQAWNGEW